MRPDKIVYGCARLTLFATRNLLVLAAMVAASGVAGCSSGDDGKHDPKPATQFESTKNVLRFKRSDRIRNDFANALALDGTALCNELGLYSCTDVVHGVALGAVEPYNVGLYEPLPRTGVTTPIIVDRVALSGCSQRVDLDLATPSAAVIFRGISITADGRLQDLEAAAVGESIDTIYRRALQRHATDEEIAHVKSLYAEVEAESAAPARDWAVLSCFSVLTTVESVFY